MALIRAAASMQQVLRACASNFAPTYRAKPAAASSSHRCALW
jgi:hypothetical protein